MASVGAKAIWDELLRQGASSIQAAGILGNIQNESGGDPEAYAIDSNGLPSVGLVQWNAGSYPGAASLRTGNPMADLVAQVKYLAQTGGFKAASGQTAAEAGGNFAANYERCQGCQPGGAQYSQRSQNAAAVFNAAKLGQWPASAGQPYQSGPGGGGGGGGDPACIAKMPSVGPIGGGCLMHRPALRHIVGGLLIGAGALIALPGLLVLLVSGFKMTGAGAAVQKTAGTVIPVAREGRAVGRYLRGDSGNPAPRKAGAP